MDEIRREDSNNEALMSDCALDAIDAADANDDVEFVRIFVLMSATDNGSGGVGLTGAI